VASAKTVKKRTKKKRVTAPAASRGLDAWPFDAGRIKADQVARTGGPPSSGDE